MTRTVSLPMKDWPEQDIAMWAGMISRAHPLDGNGALSHLRATSQLSLSAAYERWLAWLCFVEPEAVNERPEQRATVARIVAWQTALAHLSPYTSFFLVAKVLRILRAASPDADWSVQMHLANRMRRIAIRHHSPRKTGRILSSSVLLEAGLTLAGGMADTAQTPLAAALLRRNGTMVAFLALLPIRRRALSELTLGKSILVSASRIVISLSPDMTKNRLPWEAPVQAVLEPLLRRYIDEVRPWLFARGGREHDVLWVGKKGENLDHGSVYSCIVKSTFRALGLPIPPHFFRDSAASTLARESPADARLIRPLLAHSSFGTAERHYIQAQQIETGRDYASVIARLTQGDD